MMAVEGPFISAVVARMPVPEYNLGAFGVTFAFAVLVEAPVMMLMTASTALARDSVSLGRLTRFMYGLCACSTGALLLVLVPAVYDPLMYGLLNLPDPVARLTYPALAIMLPWPAAIGYRRFYQGVLIRDGQTRLVAVGTIIRLTVMTATGLALYAWGGLPGAQVAAVVLTTAVVVEAVASRWMARSAVRKLRAREPRADAAAPLDYAGIGRFYLPLALTSILGIAVHPMVTFFLGRSPFPVESLAVIPVVNALSFFFRAGSLAFQEVSIALMGDRYEHLTELRRFAWGLGLVASTGMALVGLTPLSGFWFETLSGLTPELAGFAILPAILMIPLPFLSSFLAMCRGILVTAQSTRPITVATAIEVSLIATVFPAMAWGAGVVGVTAAATAFTAGRLGSTSFLVVVAAWAVRRSPS